MSETIKTQEDFVNANRRYAELKQELIDNENLSEADRLTFYKLHQTVVMPDDGRLFRLLRKLRDLKRFNPIYILPDDERKEIFKLYETKREKQGLDRYEYRHYCFLAWKYGFEIEVGSPTLPEIIEISFEDFEVRFGGTPRRKLLIDALKQALKKAGELYQSNILNVIIGGSFLDLEKESPGDVDLILLLSANVFVKDIKPSKADAVMKMFKDEDGSNLVDIVKLPVPLDDNHYMVYELLTLLGNDPEIKSKSDDGMELKDNKFRQRAVYQLSIDTSKL